MYKRAKLSDRQICDMVIMLVGGEVEPVGDSAIDSKRHDNLVKLQNVTDLLLEEIYNVCNYHNDGHASMEKAGKQAIAWMEEKRDWLNDIFEGGE